ncbi:hypothetical protein FB645_001293 [Coemansia sp. IMI 203386]|nr:hypothetical protein FB645_001293 [Coemansia sp. IMI 203386]
MARPRNFSSQHTHEPASHPPPYPERKQTHNGHSTNETIRLDTLAQAPALPPRQKASNGSSEVSSSRQSHMGQRSHPASSNHLRSAGHSTHHSLSHGRGHGHGHSYSQSQSHGHNQSHGHSQTQIHGHSAQAAASHPSASARKPTAKELRRIRDPRLLSDDVVEKRLKELHNRAKWLDSKFSCCCGLLRFGIESLIGLIPVIGDFAGVLLAISFMNTIRRRFDVPPSIVSQMTINIAIDFCVGLVPLLGDLIDTFFKANMRNYMLVEKYVEKQRKSGHDLEMGQRSENGGNDKPGKRARIGEYIPDLPLNLKPENIAKVATKAGKGRTTS